MNLTKHMKDITSKSMFKNQALVDGWKIVFRNENVDTWLVRDVCDCEDDFKVFVEDMTNSLDARYNARVADMCKTLLYLDFETIITLAFFAEVARAASQF